MQRIENLCLQFTVKSWLSEKENQLEYTVISGLLAQTLKTAILFLPVQQ